jgi:hypothetical protein
MSDEGADLEPQADASASPEDRFADDKSVDTTVDTAAEHAVVDAKAEDVTEELESEVDSSPAEGEDLEEKADPLDDDPEYGAKVKGRIDKLTENFRNSEREADTLRQQLAEANQKLAEVPEVVDAPKTEADFDYDADKYRAYLFEESTKRGESAARRVLAENSATERTNSVAEEFEATEKEFAGTVKDYDEVVRDPSLKISPAMRDVIHEQRRPDVAYYLGSNPAEAKRIFSMTDINVGIEMHKLQSKLDTEKAKTTEKAVSKAPPPVPKIASGNERLRRSITDSDLSDGEFRKMRRKQIANR